MPYLDNFGFLLRNPNANSAPKETAKEFQCQSLTVLVEDVLVFDNFFFSEAMVFLV